MKPMKLTSLLLAAVLVCAPTGANAFFFFFIPTGLIARAFEAASGAEGNNCVTATAKVGDVIKAPSGNSATIKSLSGTSSICRNPNLPIRALLEFNFAFSSKAGMDIPDGFEPKPLNDTDRFKGLLLKAENSSEKTGFVVSARRREASTDSLGVAQGVAVALQGALEEAKTSNEEELTINGLRALRFEVAGKSKAVFHPRYTYMVTLLEAQQELVIINAWTKTDGYDKNKEVLRQLAFRVSGLNSTEGTPAVTPPPAGAPSTPSGSNVTPQAAVSPVPQSLKSVSGGEPSPDRE